MREKDRPRKIMARVLALLWAKNKRRNMGGIGAAAHVRVKLLHCGMRMARLHKQTCSGLGRTPIYASREELE